MKRRKKIKYIKSKRKDRKKDKTENKKIKI